MFGNKKGVSMLYVLMALVCVGAIGTLVLNMAKKEKADSSLRYSSELARYGSTAGLVLSINFSDADKAKDFEELMGIWYQVWQGKKPITEIKNRWLNLGSDEYPHNNHESGAYYTDEKNNKMKYRAKIVNVDFDKLEKISGEAEKTEKDSYINLMIECESIDKSGSRAKNVAFYKVYGFEKDKKSEAPTSALYMGGGMDEVNTQLEVTGINPTTKGDTFFRGSGMINEDGHIFGNSALGLIGRNGGEFRLKGTATTETQGTNTGVGVLKGSTFYGPAYFGADTSVTKTQQAAPYFQVRKWFGDKPNKFYGKFGLESSIYLTGDAENIEFYDDIFLSGAMRSNNMSKWVLKQNPTTNLYPNITITSDAIYNTATDGTSAWENKYKLADGFTKMFATPKKSDGTEVDISAETKSMTTAQILGELDMDENDPPSIDIKLDKLKELFGEPINLYTALGNRDWSITAEDLNTVHNNATNKHNDWVFVSMDRISATFVSGGSFTKKMVLLFNGTGGEHGSTGGFPSSSSSSNMLILVDDGRSIGGFGNKDTFRGLIVKRGSGVLNLGQSSPNGTMEIEGAVYCVKNNSGSSAPKFNLTGGSSNKIKIKYDPKVLQDIMDDLPDVIEVGNDPNAEQKLESFLETGIYAVQQSRLF